MNYKNERILITGGNGFIGANLTRTLLKKNARIFVITRPSSNLWRLRDIEKDIAIYRTGLENGKELKHLLQDISPTAIFHLAAYSDYRNQDDLKKIVNVSITGTLNLLLASKEIPYKIFVNTGSSSEYGFKTKPMKETDVLEPISFYASAKASSTLISQAFSFYYKKPIVTFRPFSVFGPYEEKDRFIPTIIQSLIQNTKIQLTPRSKRRDFIYVEDVVEAYMQAITYCGKLSGKICNIATGREYANDDVVNALFKIKKKHVSVEKGTYPMRLWDAPHWVASTELAKELLNWKAKHSLATGLKKTYDWTVKHINAYEDS